MDEYLGTFIFIMLVCWFVGYRMGKRKQELEFYRQAQEAQQTQIINQYIQSLGRANE